MPQRCFRAPQFGFATDEVAFFLIFRNVFSNVAHHEKTHFAVSKMAVDLASAVTTSNVVWFTSGAQDMEYNNQFLFIYN